MKNNFTGLWLILAISLALFIAYAFWEYTGEFAYMPKKAPFKEQLLATVDEDSVNGRLSFEADSIVGSEGDTNVARTDSTPQVILLFGDSMTYNLALRIAAYARQNGHEFHAINWDSSNTKIWAQSDTLSYFIDKFHPTFFFVSLGSNEIYFKKPQSRLPYIKKIIEKMEGRPYIWIGPPNWKADYGLNAMLDGNLRRGTFFRSEGIELKRKKDNIHPTREASAVWVDSIMRWMPSSAHPILSDFPADSVAKGKTDIILLKALNK